MEIKEIRYYPEQDFKLLNMLHDGIEFAYSIIEGSKETFEVYYLKDEKSENGHYYSRAYRLEKNESVPKKYMKEFEYLQDQFNKVDWVTIGVTNALMGR
jgi:hypothetical protein